MSFDAEVIRPGRGRSILVDASINGFASVPYRWGDKSGPYDGASAARQNRLVSISPIKRELGRNRIAASSTCTIEIDNADGGVDALCGRSNFNAQALARFRIYVVIWDPAAGYTDGTSEIKQLGEFVLSSWPRQTNTTVTFELADDFMGKLGAGLLLPTFEDWQSVGTTANNPFKQGIALPQSIDETTPIQLAFGEDVVLALPHAIPQGNNGTGDTYEEKIIVPMYVTTDATAVSQSLVSQVTMESYPVPPTLETVQDPNPSFRSLERSVTITGPGTFDENTVWTVEKSPAISKGGLSFYVVYLVVRTDLGNPEIRYALQDQSNPSGLQQRIDQLSALAYSGGYDAAAVDGAGTQYKCFGSRVVNWYVRCAPASQLTNAPSSTLGISHPIDVMTDLVSEYSTGTIDSTSAARVKLGTPFAACAGVVQPWTERANDERNPSPPMSLRQVLTELAQSSDIDIFIDWGGNIAFSSDVWDFTTATQAATLVEIQETELLAGISRWVPGDGERGQAFNRVYFTGGKPSPTLYEDVPFQGPFDVSTGDVSPADRALELELRQGWRPFRQQALNPMQWRGIDIVTRERVKFRTHIGGLRLELGAYFKLNWTRGPALGTPYASTVFQCESITYSPGDDIVEIEAIWRDDTQTERQYLLDDETLLVRSKGVLTGNCTENAGDTTFFDFDGTINLTTMGVAVGDILILREAAEAADSFLYNRTFRIIGINSTTQIEVTPAHTDTAHVTANAEWSIVRGATTYPTAISDPTNYPSGGDIYGKVTQSGGAYSDATTGNRLITG